MTFPVITAKRPRPMVCDACGGPRVSLQRNRVIYRRDYGDWPLIWHCSDCGAAVACHPNTDVPMGKMADPDTRRARKAAHEAFDPLWRRHHMSRTHAYTWLAEELCIPRDACHISLFDATTCERVVTICKRKRRKM